MYLLIGAALVFFSAAYVGMAAASLHCLRVKQLEAFCSLIAHIGAQIDGFLTPLDEIFRTYNDPLLVKLGFLGSVGDAGYMEAFEKCGSRIYLKSSETAVLRSFFDGLGHTSAASEVKHCLLFEKKLSEIAGKARSELAQKMKICRVLGIIIGIMLVVILL